MAYRWVRACAGCARTPAPAARLSVSHLFVRGRASSFFRCEVTVLVFFDQNSSISMDRGQFVAGMDSTRASAELDSPSIPSVTRLFEARLQPGMPPPSPLSFRVLHGYRSPFFASSRILDSGGSGSGFVTAEGATPTRPSGLPAIDLPRTADARTADAHLPAAGHPAEDELEFQDFTAAILTMRQSDARLRAGDFGGDDVQRNLFATPEVAGYRLAHARGNDNLHPEDVNLHPEDVNFVSDDDPPFIVLTETKFSFRCIPVWIGTLLTGLGSKKKNTCDNVLTMTSQVPW